MNKKIIFLILLVATLKFITSDIECTGQDCSVDFSLNSVGNPSPFVGFVKDLTGDLISGANVEILGTGHSDITTNGFYNITQGLSETFNLRASKDGFLIQTKSNQLAEFGKTKQINFTLGDPGKIKGNVLDFFTSIGINNANLSLSLYDEFLSSTLTNASGYYEFNNLVPGDYDITVSAIGYNLNSKPDNHVLGGEDTTVNFWLF